MVRNSPQRPENCLGRWETGVLSKFMRLFALNKAVFRISGNAERFLNGLTSNTLDKPRNAFLNQHGRIIATFDQVRTGADEFLIIIEPFAVDALTLHIKKFLMLNKTTAEQASFNVYFDLDGSFKPSAEEYVIPQRAGQMIIARQKLQANVSDEDFVLFRLENSIPMHGVDYTDELLLNVDEYEHVSYTKGCFLGQEPIAKVHNRSKPTWKLVARPEDELTEDERIKMTSKITDPRSGKTMGFVFVKN